MKSINSLNSLKSLFAQAEKKLKDLSFGKPVFTIPVIGSSSSHCSICDDEATVTVIYERGYPIIPKRFRESLCMACYASPGYQEFIHEPDKKRISTKLI